MSVYHFLFHTPDFGTETAETFIDVLVTTVYLLDVVNAALSFSAEGGNEQSHTGTDIR